MKLYRPVAGQFKISSPYGKRKDPKSGIDSFHYGVDFAVPESTPVVAAISGKIVLAGWEDPDNPQKGFGVRVWQQEARPDDKLVFVCYAHLSQQEVTVGEFVEAGKRIGLSGNTGKSSGPHLHLELRTGAIGGRKGEPIEF